MTIYPITTTEHALLVLRKYHPRLFRLESEGGCMPFRLDPALVARHASRNLPGESADITNFIMQAILEARSWTLTVTRVPTLEGCWRVRVYGRAGTLLGENVGAYPLRDRLCTLATAVALTEGLTRPRPVPELPVGLRPLQQTFTAMLEHLTHPESA